MYFYLYSNNLLPQIFTDIITAKGWEEFTIIYEGAELLPSLDKILNMQDLESEEVIMMNVVQLPDSEDYRLVIGLETVL